jgi:predicted transcriptional regulator
MGSEVGEIPDWSDRDVTYDGMIELFHNIDDPVLTATEIADVFGVTPQAINYRLDTLEEEGRVVRKQVGGAAVVYWLPSSPNSASAASSRPA